MDPRADCVCNVIVNRMSRELKNDSAMASLLPSSGGQSGRSDGALQSLDVYRGREVWVCAGVELGPLFTA